MTIEKPKIFGDDDIDRFSLNNMRALDMPSMINSLAEFQRKFILTSDETEQDKIKQEWETLAITAANLAETDEELQKVEVFSPAGSEARLLVENKLNRRDIAA
jgi:hypothetical protein